MTTDNKEQEKEMIPANCAKRLECGENYVEKQRRQTLSPNTTMLFTIQSANLLRPTGHHKPLKRMKKGKQPQMYKNRYLETSRTDVLYKNTYN
jgi:hypothetical protein